jgi:hypothetical protein
MTLDFGKKQEGGCGCRGRHSRSIQVTEPEKGIKIESIKMAIEPIEAVFSKRSEDRKSSFSYL